MKFSFSKDFQKKAINLLIIIVFLLALSFMLDCFMKYLPFKEAFTPASQNANGFPENWSEEFEIDVDKDSDSMGGWTFETDGSMVEINPSIDTSNGNYVYTSYSDNESGQIRLSKEITVVKNVTYDFKTTVHLGGDSEDNELHYVLLSEDSDLTDSNKTKMLPISNSEGNDGFIEIEGSYYTNSDTLAIELVSNISDKGESDKEIKWSTVEITRVGCDTTNCGFNKCKNSETPPGYTGNNTGSGLDLPTETINNVSYYYKNIYPTCKSGDYEDISSCYSQSNCGNCVPGKLYLNKTTYDPVMYWAPEFNENTYETWKPEDCVVEAGSQGTVDGTGIETRDDNTDYRNTDGVVGWMADAIGGVARGAVESGIGALTVAGGTVQALGGGIYAIYDPTTGRANVVSGAGTTVAGAEGIISGLVTAGKLPVNTLFGAVDANLISKEDLIAADNAATADAASTSDAPKTPEIPTPYTQLISL